MDLYKKMMLKLFWLSLLFFVQVSFFCALYIAIGHRHHASTVGEIRFQTDVKPDRHSSSPISISTPKYKYSARMLSNLHGPFHTDTIQILDKESAEIIYESLDTGKFSKNMEKILWDSVPEIYQTVWIVSWKCTINAVLEKDNCFKRMLKLSHIKFKTLAKSLKNGGSETHELTGYHNSGPLANGNSLTVGALYDHTDDSAETMDTYSAKFVIEFNGSSTTFITTADNKLAGEVFTSLANGNLSTILGYGFWMADKQKYSKLWISAEKCQNKTILNNTMCFTRTVNISKKTDDKARINIIYSQEIEVLPRYNNRGPWPLSNSNYPRKIHDQTDGSRSMFPLYTARFLIGVNDRPPSTTLKISDEKLAKKIFGSLRIGYVAEIMEDPFWMSLMKNCEMRQIASIKCDRDDSSQDINCMKLTAVLPKHHVFQTDEGDNEIHGRAKLSKRKAVQQSDNVSTDITGKHGHQKRNRRESVRQTCVRPAFKSTYIVSCRFTGAFVICNQTCIFGHTLDTGITKTLTCDYKENVWKPSGFSECKPYVDCSLRLVAGGKKKCWHSKSLTKAPVCDVSCKRNEYLKRVEKATYKCNNKGVWDPPLPFCASGDANLILVKPPQQKHEE